MQLSGNHLGIKLSSILLGGIKDGFLSCPTGYYNSGYRYIMQRSRRLITHLSVSILTNFMEKTWQ